jgi:hypothetical protein
MGFDRITALDPSKFKSVCCVMQAASRQHRFASVQTSPQALHDLIAEMRLVKGRKPPLRGAEEGSRQVYA